MKKFFSMLATLVISGILTSPVSAFTTVKDGDAYNFAKNIPTPTFNILYEKVGISKPGVVFSKSNGSLFEAGMTNDADVNGSEIFGVQLPYAALTNHTGLLYKLEEGDNPISGSYSFLFPDSVRDNYGEYYDLRISESDIKIGSASERGVRSTDYITLFSANRGLVSRSIGGNYSARNGMGHQGNFTITVEKNGVPIDGNFIFSVRDLDIPDHVTASTAYPNYAGPYSESFQDINNAVSKVYLTDDTTVQVIGGNRVVGSISNHDVTYKSGFALLADSAFVAHLGVSGAATGVPLLLERSFSSFEQTSSEGGTISAISRGENYDSVSGRLITIPSAADGSNAVVYTMTPNACHKAKKITLSIQDTSGNETVTQIMAADLATNPVENLVLNEETGVLTYTYPNTSDSYKRYAIHVEWGEELNCSANSAESDNQDDQDASGISSNERAVNEEEVSSEETPIQVNGAPETGAALSSEKNSGAREIFAGISLIGILVFIATRFIKHLKQN